MNHLGTLELATERLTLRRFEIEDAEYLFYNLTGDEASLTFEKWQVAASAEETEAQVEKLQAAYDSKECYCWAIEVNELEQPIGWAKAADLEEKTESVRLELVIGKAFRGKGYEGEAAAELVRFFMGMAGAGRVWAAKDAADPDFGRAMVSADMEYEGTLRKADWNNNGIVDLAVYAKVRSFELEDEPEAEETQSSAVEKILGEDGKLHNVISDETMEYVGILAKLELSPEEAESAKQDMARMLDYIDELNELDTTGIEPMSHVFPVQNVFREDVVCNGDGSKDTLANAPLEKDGGFKVPKTIGE